MSDSYAQNTGKIILTRPSMESYSFADSVVRRFNTEYLNENEQMTIRPSIEDLFLFSPVINIEQQYNILPSADSILALIVTSKNSLTQQVLTAGYQSLPVYCVGIKVAEHLKNSGFTNILKIVPTVSALYQEVVTKGGAKPYLYIRGADISFDITASMPPGSVLEVITYRAVAAKTLPLEVIESLESNDFSCRSAQAVAFFSLRSAQIFIELTKTCADNASLKSLKALCISPRVLECVQPWFAPYVYVSETPDGAGMLNLVHDFARDAILYKWQR